MSISINNYAANFPGHNSADWSPTINGCIRDHPGEIITFPPGRFRCSSTIELGAASNSKPVALTGEVSDWGHGTHLVFAAGVQAMTIRARMSRVEDLSVTGPGRTAAPIERAVLVETQCELKRFTVYKFNGVGIEISADLTRAQQTDANNWYMERCHVKQCASHGVYVHGGDTNNGVAIAVSVTSCRGHAIWDDSFLGGCWIGAHVNATLGKDAYRVVGRNNRGLFLRCYSEGNSPINVGPPAMWLGGQGGPLQGGALKVHDGRIHNATIVAPTVRAADKTNDSHAQELCRVEIPGDDFYILSYDGRVNPDGSPKRPTHFGWVRALWKNLSGKEAFGLSFGKANGSGGQTR